MVSVEENADDPVAGVVELPQDQMGTHGESEDAQGKIGDRAEAVDHFPREEF